MDIPGATVRTIHSSGGNDSQHRRRCWEVYLSDHPVPSWKQVADALHIVSGYREQEYLEELEVVQKKYLRGESAVGIVTCIIIPLLLVNMNNNSLINLHAVLFHDNGQCSSCMLCLLGPLSLNSLMTLHL